MPNEQGTGNERTGFRTWALMVGCAYATVTLCVVTVAVARVTAADGQPVSGYAAPASVAIASEPARLVGDFWPLGTRSTMPFVDTRS